jgi:peptide/nickel transport system substrate-binding protein
MMPIDRRKLTQIGFGTLLLSGCLDQAQEEKRDLSNESSNEPVYTLPITGRTTSGESMQFNVYNITNSPWPGAKFFLWPLLSSLSTKDFEWYELAAKDVNITDQRITIDLISSLEWRNGNAVTAEDVVRQHKLDAYMDRQISDFIESPEDITVSDSKTSIELTQTFNPGDLMMNAVSGGIRTPGPIFSEYLERFQDASTESAIESVREDLGQFTWNNPDPHTCGPLMIEDITNDGIEMRVSDTYPVDEVRSNLATNANIDTADFPQTIAEQYDSTFYQNQNAVSMAAISEKIDGGSGISPKTHQDVSRYPDSAEVRTLYPGYGSGIQFNLINGDHSDVWRDRRVRKAFAHIIDLESVANQFYGDFASPTRKFVGLVPNIAQNLFEEEFLQALTTYDRDLDTAEQLLREAGFTKGSKWWKKPDGTVLNPNFVGPSSVQFYISGFQVAVSNLKAFGINAELNAVEGTTFFSNNLPNLDYGITRSIYGHPVITSALRRTWFRYDGPSEHIYPAYLQEPFDSTVLEVPKVGQPMSDARIEIDIREKHNELRHATDEQQIEQIGKELCWAFNQTVPKIPVSPVPSHWYMDHSEWTYPAGDSVLGQFSGLVWLLPQFGGIGRK